MAFHGFVTASGCLIGRLQLLMAWAGSGNLLFRMIDQSNHDRNTCLLFMNMMLMSNVHPYVPETPYVLKQLQRLGTSNLYHIFNRCYDQFDIVLQTFSYKDLVFRTKTPWLWSCY
jgi:hypothetical protein